MYTGTVGLQDNAGHQLGEEMGAEVDWVVVEQSPDAVGHAVTKLNLVGAGSVGNAGSGASSRLRAVFASCAGRGNGV